MVRRRDARRPPAAYVTPWPDGELAPDAPEGTEHVRLVASALVAALEGRSTVEVARAADVNRATIADLVAGRVWPEVVTVAKLEAVLGVRLWPEGPV